jgi:thioredoxin 2
MDAKPVRCPHCGRRNRVPAVGQGIPRCGNCHNPLPWIADAADETFPQVAEQTKLPVLVDFWAPWCAPCRTLTPAIERLAASLAGRIKLVQVNVNNSPKLQHRFNIEAVPTLMVLRGQRVTAFRAGAPPEPSLRAWLEQALQNT